MNSSQVALVVLARVNLKRTPTHQPTADVGFTYQVKLTSPRASPGDRNTSKQVPRAELGEANPKLGALIAIPFSRAGRYLFA
jgi:hypothetical protein